MEEPEPKRKKPDEDWKDSEAKEQLVKDIEDGRVKADDSAKTVKLMHPELYNPWDYDYKFYERLNRIRDKILAEKKAASVDMEAFLHDSELYPVSTTTSKGELRWNGSQAEKDLKADVKAGVHKQMSSEEFFERRVSYLAFGKTKVYKHIDQEARRRKRMAEMIADRDAAEEERKKKRQKKQDERKKKAAKEEEKKKKEEEKKKKKLMKEKEKAEKEALKKKQQEEKKKLREEKKKKKEEAKKKKQAEKKQKQQKKKITK